MNSIPFYKYHGTGNDFILIDNRNNEYQFTRSQISIMCNRQFGIGADGFITLNKSNAADFEMKFWNNDGSDNMMCGNGGRCIVAFAHQLNIFDKKCRFIAPDGLHEAELIEENNNIRIISISICDTEIPTQYSETEFAINPGTPHLVIFENQINQFDVVENGRRLRNDPRFSPKGTNVNFIEVIADNYLRVRTYERGVEGETLSCGTGATASALVYAFKNKRSTASQIAIETLGGLLKVSFEKVDSKIQNIHLSGATTMIFKGSYYK